MRHELTTWDRTGDDERALQPVCVLAPGKIAQAGLAGGRDGEVRTSEIEEWLGRWWSSARGGAGRIRIRIRTGSTVDADTVISLLAAPSSITR